MLQSYISDLVEKMPEKQIIQIKSSNNNNKKGNNANNNANKCNPLNVDVVLEGGFFNGSYQLGFLHYIKQMEKKQIIKVNRLSGCSIGSTIALLYFIDISLDDCIEFVTNIIYRHIKKHCNIDIFDKTILFFKKYIPDNFLDIINKRLYITYHDISNGKQIVKSTYASIDEVFDVIRRSCYIPYITDKHILYNEKYLDGLYPYIFKPKKGCKIIYLNIINIKKIKCVASIKNEKSNVNRVIDGILDTHTFFSTNFVSNMCSYMDDWSSINIIRYKFFLYIFKISIYIFHYFYILNKFINKNINKNFNLYRLLKNIYKLLFRSIFL
jgi:hypothetical protein